MIRLLIAAKGIAILPVARLLGWVKIVINERKIVIDSGGENR